MPDATLLLFLKTYWRSSKPSEKTFTTFRSKPSGCSITTPRTPAISYRWEQTTKGTKGFLFLCFLCPRSIPFVYLPRFCVGPPPRNRKLPHDRKRFGPLIARPLRFQQ